MKTIGRLLKAKGREIWSVTPDSSVYDAIALMASKVVGALMVMDGEQLVGVISERDYARKIILEGRSSRETPVREIMSDRVICVSPDQTIEEGMAVMTDKRVRHLPVVEAGRILGVISIGDLVKGIIEEQKFIIEQLEHYIAS